MADDLQAVIGQLFVVGGRAVRMPPPGALAETAPKRVPRAREGDTFYVLVTPAGEPRVPSAVFEQMAQLGADAYFGSGGGITGGLREALTAIHQQARDQQPVNVLAVVQRGSDLYTARGGKTFGVLYRSDQAVTGEALAFIPADRHDPLEMNLPPLGESTTSDEPDIQLGRYTAAPDAVLLLSDESLIAKGDETWHFVLSRGTVESVIDALRGVAGLDAAASVIRFLAPGATDPSGTVPPPSPRAPRAALPRESRPAMPLAPETPPQRDPEPAPPQPAPQPAPTPFILDDEPAPAAGDSAPFVAGSMDALLAAEASADAADSPDERDASPSGLGRLFRRSQENAETPDSAAEMEVPAPDKTKREPSVIAQASARVKQVGRDGVRGVLAGVLGVITFFVSLLEGILPTPDDEGRQGISTPVAVGLAVLIPLVIVIVVVGMALSEQGKTDYEVVLERAQAKHQEALTLSGQSCDNRALRPLWVEVLSLAQQAAQYRQNDVEVLVIEADARNYLDCYDGVVRRNLSLLHAFEPDAELVGPVVNGGVDLFVLDAANDAVYHDTLNVTGDGLTTRSDDPILWRGYSTSDGEFAVQDLIDIEWLASGGTVHDNVLIALERNGSLWAYSPTFFTTVQQLITSGWVNPVAVAVFDQWLYVLDSGADQVWRYMPPAGENAYSVAPEEYFNGEEIPDLSDAVDIGISSDEGAVYILFRDGIVRKYRRNIQGYVEEQPFVYKEQPVGALASGQALFIDNDPASVSLYIVDQENATIYRTTFSGRYNRGIRAQNLPDAFNDVSGIYADAVVRNNMYVVAGNKLYYFPREQP